MAYLVHITARALREIDGALAWISERSPAAASRWHQRILIAMRSLENNPERWSLAPESEWYPAEIRQMLHGKKRGVYRILFIVRGNSVYVLRVRHGAQVLLMPGEL